MKRIMLTLLAVISLALSASAQAQVKWRTAVRMSSPTEGEVTVRAIVADGWHLYGINMPEGGPKATAFDFSASRGVDFTGKLTFAPAPLKKLDEAFGMELEWWSGSVVFTRRFRVVDPETARIEIKIGYMICNGANCLPPRTENVSVAVPPFKKP